MPTSHPDPHLNFGHKLLQWDGTGEDLLIWGAGITHRGLVIKMFTCMSTNGMVICLRGEQMARGRPVTAVAVGQSKVPCMHVQFHYYLKVLRKV